MGVNVPVPPPVQYVGQPVEITPQYGGVYHHSGQYLGLRSHLKRLDKVSTKLKSELKSVPAQSSQYVGGSPYINRPQYGGGSFYNQGAVATFAARSNSISWHLHVIPSPSTPLSSVIQQFLHNRLFLQRHNCITLQQIPSLTQHIIQTPP